MLAEGIEGLRLHEVSTPSQRDRFRAPFASAYARIFAGPPYHERFTEQEATQIYDRITSTPSQVTLVLTLPDSEQVIAFASAVPLSSAPQVAQVVRGLVPQHATMYLIELGVDPAWRGRKLGKRLVRERIQRIDTRRYTHAVLRVTEGRTEAFAMYRKLGFTDMGVSMQVEQLRADGEVRSDERHFMSRVISQIHTA